MNQHDWLLFFLAMTATSQLWFIGSKLYDTVLVLKDIKYHLSKIADKK